MIRNQNHNVEILVSEVAGIEFRERRVQPARHEPMIESQADRLE